MEPIGNFYYDSGSLYNERTGLKINEIINRLNFLTGEEQKIRPTDDNIYVCRCAECPQLSKTRIEGQIEGLKMAEELLTDHYWDSFQEDKELLIKHIKAPLRFKTNILKDQLNNI